MVLHPGYHRLAGDHLRGVLEAGFGDCCAGEHSGYFVGAGAVVEEGDLGPGAAVGLALVDEEVLVGEGGDLWQMGHAQNLLAAAEGFELLADGFRGAAADADVDLVEDQRARGGSASSWAWTAPSSTLTLRASMTRDISPPEAISRGLRGSPGLVAMRYSTVSQPEAVQWDCSSLQHVTATSKWTFMARELIWASASLASLAAAARRSALRAAAAER
jgi:hypothetical protein